MPGSFQMRKKDEVKEEEEEDRSNNGCSCRTRGYPGRRKKKKTDTKGENAVEEDLISELPDDVLHCILSRLTLKEACRTAILSKGWRHLFHTLPALTMYSSNIDPYHPHHEVGADLEHWIRSVHGILNSRREPVRYCSVYYSFSGRHKEDFDAIVSSLCNDDICRLVLANVGTDHYRFPRSSLFSCKALQILYLIKCRLVVPCEFTGFSRLRTLYLSEVIVSNQQLEQLVSCCQFVQTMSILNCSVNNLTILSGSLCELNLRMLKPSRIYLVKAPQLRSISIHHDVICDVHFGPKDADGNTGRTAVSRLVGLLEGFGHIRRLTFWFSDAYTKNLTGEKLPLPKSLPCEHHLRELKTIWLRMDLREAYMGSILALLLNSSPSLEELEIMDKGITDGYNEYLDPHYWDNQVPSNCVRNRLTSVAVCTESKYTTHLFGFVKFLLVNASGLKKMTIAYDHEEQQQFARMGIREWLLRLQWASPDAVLEFKSSLREKGHFWPLGIH